MAKEAIRDGAGVSSAYNGMSADTKAGLLMDELSKTLNAVHLACRQKEYARAKEICDVAEARFPNELARVFWLRSIVANREGNKNDERFYLETSISLQPDHRGTVAAYGDFLIQAGETTEAVLWLEKLIALDQAAGSIAFTQGAHLAMAYCYYVKGNRKEANQQLAMVGNLFPSAPVRLDPMLTYQELKVKISRMA